jgi:hypothetical protein
MFCHFRLAFPMVFNMYIERIKGIHAGHDYLVEHMRSTGLYAKAGTLIDIQVAKAFVNKIKVSQSLLRIPPKFETIVKH